MAAGGSSGDARLRRAEEIARGVHRGQVDRYGRPMIEHVMRVAEAVPGGARVVAVLHDVPERSAYSPADLGRLASLADDEVAALELLTEAAGESIVEHTTRVIHAVPGTSRDLAMSVKRADVADHLQFGDGDAQHRAALELLQAVA